MTNAIGVVWHKMWSTTRRCDVVTENRIFLQPHPPPFCSSGMQVQLASSSVLHGACFGLSWALLTSLLFSNQNDIKFSKCWHVHKLCLVKVCLDLLSRKSCRPFCHVFFLTWNLCNLSLISVCARVCVLASDLQVCLWNSCLKSPEYSRRSEDTVALEQWSRPEMEGADRFDWALWVALKVSLFFFFFRAAKSCACPIGLRRKMASWLSDKGYGVCLFFPDMLWVFLFVCHLTGLFLEHQQFTRLNLVLSTACFSWRFAEGSAQ